MKLIYNKIIYIQNANSDFGFSAKKVFPTKKRKFEELA